MRKEEIKKIKVVSNTHWDREFRRSFEKTRHSLIQMMDTTIAILENDPDYDSFTMDGHTIMIDDYLEMKPEMYERVTKLIQDGRLIIGPYYTLAEEFSVGDEALVRNLIWGRNNVEKYGGKPGTVAYTPSSWGQTGQLPQILMDFGLDKMMFYRGISHHESSAEYIWAAPDGTKVYASRFAIYARYNWYYQVHRKVTRDTVFDKTYQWGKYNEIPMRFCDTHAGSAPSFDLKDPQATYSKDQLKKAIEDMLEREAGHFTTPVFLAMHGHDISVAHPQESQIIKDAKEIFEGKYEIEHCTLEEFWRDALPYLNDSGLPVLEGERRAYLKEGMWTFLFPGTISARTYLKQFDDQAYYRLTATAEPLASLAMSKGMGYPDDYLHRGWTFLMSNHTHDANGGCAPDAVCQDMEYRYRKVNDISEIVTEDAIAYITKNLSSKNTEHYEMQVTIFNSRPYKRDKVVAIDLEIPTEWEAKAVELIDQENEQLLYQPIIEEKSSVFVDSAWEVPTILSTDRIQFWVKINNIPALGYKSFSIKPLQNERRKIETLVTGSNSMENEFLRVHVNTNGTVNIEHKSTGRTYHELNYLLDEGEAGNAWQHIELPFDKKINSRGVHARVSIIEQGSLTSTICAEYFFTLPSEYVNSESRSEFTTDIPVKVSYTLEKGNPALKVKTELINNAKDHWLRACFPTDIDTQESWSDSHFNVLSRDISLPDSTGWVEEAQGMHPLRTFVDLNDGHAGISVCPKGLFEFEILHDKQNTIALTLLRACRIKLKVSEEKTTELPDIGIQCPGKQIFEYTIYPHSGDWQSADSIRIAEENHAEVRMVQSGPGKGSLPAQCSFIESLNPRVHITAIKKAENGEDIIVRMFNQDTASTNAKLKFETTYTKIINCGMAEDKNEIIDTRTKQLDYPLKGKRILTIKLVK